MDASVLIIEDDQDIADLIAMYLKDEGIRSDIALTAEAGLELSAASAYDLVVLDLNLPRMDGYEFLQTFRRMTDTPVVIVSSRDADEDMILGLGLGADDFVNKPFSPRVLTARIRAHLRRSHTPAMDQNREVIQFGDISMDLGALIVERRGEPLAMPTKELELLAYFARNRGVALKTEQIYKDVWGNLYGDYTTVAVHVQRLRKRIEPDPAQPCFIKTIYGIGYRFEIPTEASACPERGRAS